MNNTNQPPSADLGELERQVMDLIWQHAPCTAEQVRAKIDRPLKESTIRTVLHRLEEKGYLTHALDNRTYVYRAAEAREQVAAKAVQRIVDWFCKGSVEDLLTGMVDASVVDREELQRLAVKIARAKKGERK